MDATISLNTVFWLVAGIAGIIGLIKVFKKPFDQLDDHEHRLKALEKSRIERKQTDQYIMRALNSIVNHMIDGNSIDKLKEVRDEYQEHIIEHHN